MLDQVDQQYSDLYPDLGPEMKNLCGMVTHTDAMIGDIVDELNTTGLLDNTVLIFMGDNGGQVNPATDPAGISSTRGTLTLVEASRWSSCNSAPHQSRQRQ